MRDAGLDYDSADGRISDPTRGGPPDTAQAVEAMMRAIFPGRFKVACRRAYIRLYAWLRLPRWEDGDG